MPFYDYKCRNCKEQTEVFHSMKECTEEKSNVLVCEKCGNVGMDRMMTGGEVPRFSLMNAEQRRESLKKRSHEHFNKEIKEKFHYMNSKSYIP